MLAASVSTSSLAAIDWNPVVENAFVTGGKEGSMLFWTVG